MRRSEGRILTSHTGRLFKPGSGWNGMGGSIASCPGRQLPVEVTRMVQAQLDIGMDVVSEPAGDQVVSARHGGIPGLLHQHA